MAINDRNEGSSNEQASNSRFGERAERADRGQEFSFHGGARRRGVVPANNLSAYFMAFREKMKGYLATGSSSYNYEYRLTDIDKQQFPNLGYSALVLSGYNKDLSPDTATYFVFIIEATGDGTKVITRNIGRDKQVEMLVTPGDAMDEVLLEIIKARLADTWKGTPVTNFVNIEGMVIPKNFKPDDHQAVTEVGYVGALALVTELDRQADALNDFNLKYLERDARLTVNLTVEKPGEQVTDMFDRPVRADMRLQLISSKRGGNEKSLANAQSDQAVVVEVAGFTDLIYDADDSDAFSRQDEDSSRSKGRRPTYLPQFIVTKLNTINDTPSEVALAIATATNVTMRHAWLNGFQRRPVEKGVLNLKNYGTLNVEADIFGTRDEQPVNTSFDAMDDEDYKEYLKTIVSPNLLMSFDCPEMDSSSWYLSMIAEASKGNAAAERQLIDSFDTLTDGRFSENFGRGNRLFLDSGSRVLMGSWSHNGVIEDIRTIDYTAVFNATYASTPQAILDWAGSFRDGDIDLAQRLQKQRQVIDVVSRNTANYTGWAHRANMSSKAVLALVDAISSVGVDIGVSLSDSIASMVSDRRARSGYSRDDGLGANVSFGRTRSGGRSSNMGGYRSGRY
jgi:hypothetical protein